MVPPEDRVISLFAGLIANHDRAHSPNFFFWNNPVHRIEKDLKMCNTCRTPTSSSDEVKPESFMSVNPQSYLCGSDDGESQYLHFCTNLYFCTIKKIESFCKVQKC